MTPGQRKRYHADLWPAAALANEWDLGDDERRRRVTRDCMAAIGARITDSTSGLDEDEITALFCYLEHLGDGASLDKSARWDTCRQDYKTYARAKQADWHERQLYGQGKNKLDRNRFKGEASAQGGPLDDLDPEEIRKRHITFASRHQAKQRSEAKAARATGQKPASQTPATPAPAPLPVDRTAAPVIPAVDAPF